MAAESARIEVIERFNDIATKEHIEIVFNDVIHEELINGNLLKDFLDMSSVFENVCSIIHMRINYEKQLAERRLLTAKVFAHWIENHDIMGISLNKNLH